MARAVAAALTQGPAVPGSSARCILNTAEACVFVYLLGQDLSVILVGPTDWNIALTGRRVERFLVDFVDTYLAETVAELPGEDPGPCRVASHRRPSSGPVSGTSTAATTTCSRACCAPWSVSEACGRARR